MPTRPTLQPGRREWLYSIGKTMGGAIGGMALHCLMAEEAILSQQKPASQGTSNDSPLTPKQGHLPSRAKQVIFLMMEGGPSHIDTFDPKPALQRFHLKEFVREGKEKSAMESGKRYYVQSPFRFIQAGKSRADMAENWIHLSQVADELCFFRGCTVDSVNHPTAMFQMNCGNRFGGDPALGAWMTYGLGSIHRDMPGFVVLPEVSYPQGGSANWSNGFLPTHFQGTALRPTGSPILDLEPPKHMTREMERWNIDLLKELNRSHALSRPGHDELEASTANYELAFRMQMEVPGVLDIEQEDAKTKSLYGIGQKETDRFGRKCLLARKLVEKGVRFVQLYNATWDSHDFIERAHGNLIRGVDRPIAGLIQDLKNRGLLDSTLVVWCGEFGRTPDNGVRQGTAYGRDHNPNAMTIWLAGGGCNAGHTIGATDELGMEAVEKRSHVRDFHVTLLRLLGLDDNRLTFYHAGRFKQLSQFGGEVIQDLIA